MTLVSLSTVIISGYRCASAKRPSKGEKGTRKWSGVDSAWEQKKLEAREMRVNLARREAAVPPA